ncbi:MAG: SIMPL domain-containing protein [Halobacteriaceae archaeon]
MRHTLATATVAVALVVATAGCLGAAAAPTATDATAADLPTVSARGTGTATADPDLAVVSVAVDVTADTAAGARSETAAGVADVRAALRDLGLDDDAVTTRYYSLRQVRDRVSVATGGDAGAATARESPDDETRTRLRYRAVHALTVETTPDRAGEVVDAGATRVDGVQFTLSAAARETLREEAVAAAVDDARADAAAAAAAAGASLGTVRTVAVDGGYGYPVPYADAAAERGATSFAPGPVTVTVTVHATYALSV